MKRRPIFFAYQTDTNMTSHADHWHRGTSRAAGHVYDVNKVAVPLQMHSTVREQVNLAILKIFKRGGAAGS
ncbi:uncharacterized [Tachysurus ichikawai]